MSTQPKISSDRKLVAFLYLLARDELAMGIVNKLVKDVEAGGVSHYTDGWLASAALEWADKLTESK